MGCKEKLCILDCLIDGEHTQLADLAGVLIRKLAYMRKTKKELFEAVGQA